VRLRTALAGASKGARAPVNGEAVSKGRLPPVELRKPPEVVIVSDPGATVLNRQRREPRAGTARPADTARKTNPLEDRPVARTGMNLLAVRLSEQIVAESESFLD